MLLRKEINSRRRAGFTLMEMLVVVAIIVALAGIGGYFLMGALTGAKKDVARTQTKTISKACDTYQMRHGGAFPENLEVLLVKDELGNAPILESRDAITDPWGRPYQYDKSGPMNQGMHADIWTTDPGDQTQTKIGNWPNSAQQQPR
jgi:general secretion pathway protein G